MEMINKIESHQGILSLEKTNALKGIFSVLIVFTHLHTADMLIRTKLLNYIWGSMGFLVVGGFFFFTGYGMIWSSDHKVGYARTIWRKVLSLYLFYCIVLVCYCLVNLICGISISQKDILRSLTFGGNLVRNGWFFQSIFVVYVMFGALLSDINRSAIGKTGGVLVFCIVYWIICVYMKLNEVWYQSIFGLWAGVVLCVHPDIYQKIQNKPITYICLIVFVVFFRLSSKSLFFKIEFRAIAIMLFPVVVLLISEIIPERYYNNRVTQFLAYYSLEIYAFHGLFITIVQKWKSTTPVNNIAMIMFVLIGTLAISIVFKHVFRQIKIFVYSKNDSIQKTNN